MRPSNNIYDDGSSFLKSAVVRLQQTRGGEYPLSKFWKGKILMHYFLAYNMISPISYSNRNLTSLKNYILHIIKYELALVSCHGRLDRDGCLVYKIFGLLLYCLTTSKNYWGKLFLNHLKTSSIDFVSIIHFFI